jgi:hypothetical protein
MTQNWTINGLAEETGMDRRTIKKILSTTAPNDIDGKNEYYKLGDFVQALIAYHSDGAGGTLEKEKIRKTKLEADYLKIKIGEAEKNLIPVEFVEKAWESQMTSLRQAVMFSAMSEDAKRESLETLMQIPVDEYFSYSKEQSDESEAEVAEAP